MSDTALLPDAGARSRHGLVQREEAAYLAHPHLAVAADGTYVLVYNSAPAREVVLHPPQEPAFRNMVTRSLDEGETWSAPEPVPDAGATGMECAGLTALPDGAILLNQWQFRWQDAATSADPDLARPADLATEWARSAEFAGLHAPLTPASIARLFPLARGGGRPLVSRAASASAPFAPACEIDTAPFRGGYGMRGGLVLPDGDVLLPLCDVPRYATVYTVRLREGVQVGPPVLAAATDGRSFEEPAPILLDDGTILLVLRENVTRRLHTVRSTDGGATFSPPEPTEIGEYPAHLVRLRDGRIAMVAGRREPPFGVVLYIADAAATHWSGPVAVRADLPNRDLGYPACAQRRNGDLFVVYYGRDATGASSILSTTVPHQAFDMKGVSNVRG